MTKRVRVAVLLLTSSFALGGCQLFKPSGLGVASSKGAVQAERQTSFGDLGREHLRAGRYGLAIEAFERSLAFGEQPAPAYNGLGVAYAKLGRPELAYRFFRKALMSDPDNPVYSRNMAALMDSPEFNLAALKRSEPQRAKAGNNAERNAAGSAVRTPGKLFREGNGQFSLVTRAPEGEQDRLAAKPAAGSCPKARQCTEPQMPKVASRKPNPDAPAVKQAGRTEAAAQASQSRRKTVVLPSASDAEAAVKPATTTT